MISKRKRIASALGTMGLVSVLMVNTFGAQTKKMIEVVGNGIKLVVDGQNIQFGKDIDGNPVEPFVFKGVTYVPIRTIGEAFDKQVDWDEKNKTVYIGERTEEKQTYLGTKTPYPYEEGTYTAPPKGYKPIFINYVGRHGSRHLSSSKYDKTLMELLSIAEKEGQITNMGKELKSEIARLMEIEKDNYGLLSISGAKELEGIGTRVGKNYKEVFDEDKKIIAQATFKDRTPQSRDNFIDGLKKSLKGAQLDIEVSAFEEEKDPYLRPFDIAEKYDQYAEDGEWNEVFDKYISKDTGVIYAEEVLLQFFSESFYNRLEAGEFQLKDEKGKVKLENPTDAASNLYQLYIISSNIKEEGIFDFGKYFSTDQLKWYESIDNLEDFYEKGPSLTSTDLPQNISAPLVKELINSTEDAIEDEEIAGIFRFAHAETIIPLSSFLDIKGANVSTDNAEEVTKVWKGSEVSPMAANIQWILYSNGDDDECLVKLLRNEKEVAFPIQTKTYPYYKWQDVKEYYEGKVKDLGVDLDNSFEEDITVLKEKF